MLVERGKLDLDDTLYEIFPGFGDFAKDITITHLLQHTSGLLDYEDFVPSDSQTQVHDSDVLEIVKATDHTYFAPGSEYRYSNSGYALIAMMVEKYSGQTFPVFLRENIFDRVGMSNTVAFVEGINEVPHRAYGYSVGVDAIENTDQSPWSAVLGDGGIYASLDDLYKWDQALYTDQLISIEMLQKSWTPNLESYGFGWRIDTHRGKRRYHHSGSTSGFRNYIERYPDEKLTIIVLTNRADPEVGALAEKVADLFLE
jgi:CubicO group peptidase (beta-lactamase class C family)